MHAGNDAGESWEGAIGPRLWSYDPLRRRAQVWRPCHEDRSLDRSRIGSIALPHLLAEHGLGEVHISGPDRRELAKWLHGIGASFSHYLPRHPAHARKVERVFTSFVEFDEARREWRRAPNACGHLRSAQAARLRRQRQHEAEATMASARQRLTAFLRYGLERREGERLAGDTVWIHCLARGIHHRDLRVCEQCGLVFRAPRATRCGYCQRHPLRISLRPAFAGGWHTGVRVGSRFFTGEFEREVFYSARCQDCGNGFESRDPRQSLCRNCGSGAGRARRRRGSASRTGRQRFRFVHAEGAHDFSVGFATTSGESVNLVAEGGAIETDDAEIARALAQMGTLRPHPEDRELVDRVALRAA